MQILIGPKELEKQFRNQFRDLLLPLINWKNKSNNDIKKFTKNLKNFFETNKPSINTLIPVDINMKPVLDLNTFLRGNHYWGNIEYL